MAQTGTIQGRVLDTEDQPLTGANVLVVDEGVGAVVGPDGSYSITIAPGTYVLRASFIGFDSSEFPVSVSAGGAATQNFVLGAAELDEVTVTADAYGVRRESAESGSSSIVDGQTLETITVRSADAALQGRAAGVRITSSSGQPGSGLSVNVRGSGSITAGSTPLYIVDGVQVENSSEVSSATRLGTANILSGINPQDIASIEVLKDAAAASIYGAEAANGVVLITTKRGRAGRTQIEFSTQIGTSERANTLDLLNTQQYLGYRYEGYQNVARLLGVGTTQAEINAFARDQTVDRAGGVALDIDGDGVAEFVPEQRVFGDFNGDGAVGDDEFRLADTNWQDFVYRNALKQQYSLSARGGNEKTTFFVSGRYVDDEGIIAGSDFRQYGLRLNLDHRLSDDVGVGARVNVANSNTNGAPQGTNSTQQPSWTGNLAPPNTTPYNVVGDPASGFNPRILGSLFSNNPAFFSENVINTADAAQITASASLDARLLDNVSAKTFAGISYIDYQEAFFGDPRIPSFQSTSGFTASNASRTTELNASQTVNYTDIFSEVHRVGGLLGVEYRLRNEDDLSASSETLPFFEFTTLSAASVPDNPTQFKTESVRGSVFGSLDYTYDNTYQISTVLRYDGSSRFGADNRYGLFGTIAGFARLNEAMGLDPTTVPELKLRASYGVTGNSAIGDFDARQLIAGLGDGYNGQPSIRPSTLGNNLLTWEEKSEANVGLDYALFSGRVSGSVDVYTQNVDELLLDAPLPLDSGFGTVIENLGTIRQQGIELAINTINIQTPMFGWSTTFNIAFQRGEVLSLVNDEDQYVIGGRTYEVNEAPAQLEYIEYAGANPATGRPMYFDADGNLTYTPTDADEKYFGNADPDYFGGFQNSFRVGDFTLDAFVQYDFGRTTLNNDRFFSDSGVFTLNTPQSVYDDRWQQPGDITGQPHAWFTFTYPDGSTPSNPSFTSRYVEDASYVRLKLVTLTYQVPTSLFRFARLPAQSASIYIQGENLLTATGYRGLDPELVGNGLGEYPQARTFLAGIRLGL